MTFDLLNDMLHSIMLLWRTRSAPSCGSLRVSCGTSIGLIPETAGCAIRLTADLWGNFSVTWPPGRRNVSAVVSAVHGAARRSELPTLQGCVSAASSLRHLRGSCTVSVEFGCVGCSQCTHRCAALGGVRVLQLSSSRGHLDIGKL